MTTQQVARKPRWAIGFIVVLAVVVALGWAFLQYRRPKTKVADAPRQRSVQKKPGDPDFLEMPADVLQAMHLKTQAAAVPRFSKVLHLRGSLAIDSNRQSDVHARFAGQIVELATLKGLKSQQSESEGNTSRTLQNFDSVEQGTPMAVIWSKDLGEKKSQFALSLAKLRVDKQTLASFKTLTKTGGISDRELREKQAEVDQGEINVFNDEATLRAYQVTDEDINQVKEASEKIHLGQKADKSFARDWPRVVVSAPISGVIVDKVVTVGEIVDANDDLFKIADLSVLALWLHAFEEDLPALEQLPKPLQVSVKIPAHPESGELHGEIDRLSPIIDPNEHMALLIGTLHNPKRDLLANQFITADVGIPPEPGVVEIPTNAVIDVGNDAIAFVQPDATKPQLYRRRVIVVQRYFDVVYVRSELSDEQKKQGLHEIHVGDSVVAGGILELEDYLQQF